jgi:hypothetical protein
VTEAYGSKWLTRQKLIRELRTVLLELDAAEAEDRRLRQAMLNAGLKLPATGLGSKRTDTTPDEVPVTLKAGSNVRETDAFLHDLAGLRTLFDFKRKHGRGIGPTWNPAEAA